MRCQPIRASGLTMTKASFQLHRRDQSIREKRAESCNYLARMEFLRTNSFVYALQKAGLDKAAAKLRQALERH